MSKSNAGFVIKHITKRWLVSPNDSFYPDSKLVKLETFNNERDETKVEYLIIKIRPAEI